ncbi:hypothetical protein FACS1894189_7510 [Planctomycetales bacterium]|nr:hypothetical protein FACS1894189_7510 [Planctomycetales bacterium]
MRVTEQTIYNWCKEDVLPYVRIGNRYRIFKNRIVGATERESRALAIQSEIMRQQKDAMGDYAVESIDRLLVSESIDGETVEYPMCWTDGVPEESELFYHLTFVNEILVIKTIHGQLKAKIVGDTALLPMQFLAANEPTNLSLFKNFLTFLDVVDVPLTDYEEVFQIHVNSDADYWQDFEITAAESFPSPDYWKEFAIQVPELVDFAKDFSIITGTLANFTKDFQIQSIKYGNYEKLFIINAGQIRNYTQDFTIEAKKPTLNYAHVALISTESIPVVGVPLQSMTGIRLQFSISSMRDPYRFTVCRAYLCLINFLCNRLRQPGANFSTRICP